MSINEHNFDRLARVITALEAATGNLEAARRDAWLELPLDEPMRDPELDAVCAKAIADIRPLLLRALEARQRHVRAFASGPEFRRSY